jgi:CDP-glucose 4,6-dehydratase
MENLVTVLSKFRGKRVLITGDTGFKGSWLSFWLLQYGADVYGYALPALTKSHFRSLRLDKSMDHKDGDVRDAEFLRKTFRKVKPEVVFHLAAQPIVRRSYRDPVETFETNVSGAVNLLESVRLSDSVTSLVFVTSDKCYKNIEQVAGYTESDQLGGHDPYSASKAAAELVFSSYNDSFFKQRQGFGAASGRAGNVIGGGDWSEDRIIPDCIRSLTANKPIVLRNPNATRPWQHVLEPLSGYIVLAERLMSEPKSVEGAWNFGPDEAETRTVHDVAQAAVGHWGSGSVEIESNHSHPHEANLLQLDCTKARQQLQWAPRWHFAETVEKTVQWYKQVEDGAKAIDVTTNQLSQYERKSHD